MGQGAAQAPGHRGAFGPAQAARRVNDVVPHPLELTAEAQLFTLLKLARNKVVNFRMSKGRRLTGEQRLALIAQRRKGVGTKELAQKFGISDRAVRFALAAEKQRKITAQQKDTTIAVRIDGDAVQSFDTVILRLDFRSRSEALRRMIYGAAGFFSPDEQLADEVRRAVAELAKVGTNVNQIARRLNQAAMVGSHGTVSRAELEEVRQVATLVQDLRTDLLAVINRRRRQLEDVLRDVLGDEAGDEG